MQETERAAFIITQAVCAFAHIEAMKATNKGAEYASKPPVYLEGDFLRVPEIYGIQHNQVTAYLHGR